MIKNIFQVICMKSEVQKMNKNSTNWVVVLVHLFPSAPS